MDTAFIGITCPTANIKFNMSSSQSVTLLANTYIEIVNDYNCIPILIPSNLEAYQLESISRLLNGLILSSGQDIDSNNYDEPSRVEYSSQVSGLGDLFKRSLITAPDIKRDESEIQLYHLAKSKGIPILGICRGMQLINVAEGGTLHQELTESSVDHYLGSDGWINYHDIQIVPGTLCHKLLGESSGVVSSIHHQAVKKLGSNLLISGYSPDGVIELIEHKEQGQFIIGVQGHIEKTRKNQPMFENIFKELFRIAKLQRIKKNANCRELT